MRLRLAPSGPFFDVVTVGELAAQRAIYVSAGGDDTNSGLSRAVPKLTINAARDAAAAAGASAVDPWALVSDEASVFTENVEVPAGVSIWMPNATLVGSNAASAALIVNDSCTARLHAVQGLDGQIVTLKDEVGTSAVDLDVLRTGIGGVGALNISLVGGAFFYLVRTTMVAEDGTGVGDISNDVGHMHVDCQDVYLIGPNATGLARLGSGTTVGRIVHLLELGAGVGTGLGLNVLSGEVDLEVGEHLTTTAFQLAGTSILREQVQRIEGAEVVAAGALAEINGKSEITITATTPALPLVGSGATRYVWVNGAGGPITVPLPATPNPRSSVVVKDIAINAAANPITVSGNGNQVDSLPSTIINTNHGFVRTVWNGTMWSLV